jgi:hypothetical protein
MSDNDRFVDRDVIIRPLRKAFRERRFWRMNLVNADSSDEKEQMTTAVFDEEMVTLSDWGAARKDQSLLNLDLWEDAGTDIERAEIDEALRDDITGEIDWDLVRDRLHQWIDKETKVKAGKAAGCIRRFLFEFEVGDVLILNTAAGTVIAVVTSPPFLLNRDSPHRDVDSDHMFGRDVEFVVDEDGNIVTLDKVPKEMEANQNTITKVDKEALRGILGKTKALETLSMVGEWDA